MGKNEQIELFPKELHDFMLIIRRRAEACKTQIECALITAETTTRLVDLFIKHQKIKAIGNCRACQIESVCELWREADELSREYLEDLDKDRRT